VARAVGHRVNDPRPWRAILEAIAAAVAADPAAAELGATLASGWTANTATPAIVVAPVRRAVVRPNDVRWELALQVVIGVQGDDDEALHSLLELALAAIPPGVLVGDTVYGQDERGGATYIVGTTTLTA
jgi:hypothetical protein